MNYDKELHIILNGEEWAIYALFRQLHYIILSLKVTSFSPRKKIYDGEEKNTRRFLFHVAKLPKRRDLQINWQFRRGDGNNRPSSAH